MLEKKESQMHNHAVSLSLLPSDIHEHIIRYLSWKDVRTLARVNRVLREATERKRLRKFKKCYLQTLAIHGAVSSNAVFFRPISDPSSIYDPVDWINLCTSLPITHAPTINNNTWMSTPDYEKINISNLKKYHSKWIIWVKQQRVGAAALPQKLQINPDLFPSSEYYSLLAYAIQSGYSSAIKILVSFSLHKRDEWHEDVIWPLLSIAAISSHGQPTARKPAYQELVNFLVQKIPVKQSEKPPSTFKKLLTILAAQGNLEMYQNILKNQNFQDDIDNGLKCALLEKAIAYGHLEFVKYLISQYPGIVDNYTSRQSGNGASLYLDGADIETMRNCDLLGNPVMAAIKYEHKDIAYYFGGIDAQTPENALSPREQSKKRLLDYLLRSASQESHILALVCAVFSHMPMHIEENWEKPLGEGELGVLYKDLSQHFSLPRMDGLTHTYRALCYAFLIPPDIEHPLLQIVILLFSPIIISALYLTVLIMYPLVWGGGLFPWDIKFDEIMKTEKIITFLLIGDITEKQSGLLDYILLLPLIYKWAAKRQQDSCCYEFVCYVLYPPCILLDFLERIAITFLYSSFCVAMLVLKIAYLITAFTLFFVAYTVFTALPSLLAEGGRWAENKLSQHLPATFSIFSRTEPSFEAQTAAAIP